MKATATRIGKSKNESIELDGRVVIKKTLIGGWNFVGRVRHDGNSKVGVFIKSATRSGIEELVRNFNVPVISFDVVEVQRDLA